MNLPQFPDDYIPASPEARRRLIAWGEECARMGAEAERLSFYSAQVSGEPATVREAKPQYPWGSRRVGIREWLFGPRQPPPICADTAAPKDPFYCWNVRCQLGGTCCRAIDAAHTDEGRE